MWAPCWGPLVAATGPVLNNDSADSGRGLDATGEPQRPCTGRALMDSVSFAMGLRGGAQIARASASRKHLRSIAVVPTGGWECSIAECGTESTCRCASPGD